MKDQVLPAEAIAASAGAVELVESYLAGDLDETDFRTAGGFRVTTIGTAAWAMAKYRSAEKLAAGIRSQAAEWRSDVDAWERDALVPLNRTLDFMGENLRQYALEVRAASGDVTKTVKLPGGRIETRKPTRPRLIVDDEPAFLAWCRTNQ